MTRVLIVDDQPAFRRQLRQLLTLAGLTVVGEAGDIPEAEIQVKALQPDLAVVDVILPGINGLEGVPRLRALAPNLRVILVSAYRDRAEVFRTAAKEAGAEAFIPKDDLDLEVARTWTTPYSEINRNCSTHCHSERSEESRFQHGRDSSSQNPLLRMTG
jgi:DNA-binding NarL/FixJ family response regulator